MPWKGAWVLKRPPAKRCFDDIVEMQEGTRHESDILKSAIKEAYGMDFVNAKRVLKTKFKRKNRDGLTLADRIRMNRYGNGSADGTSGERNDSAFASVDIADFASLEENERRSPTPEPTISREAANQRQTPPKVIMNYKVSHWNASTFYTYLIHLSVFISPTSKKN